MTENEPTDMKRKTPRARGSGRIFKPKGSRYWWVAYRINGRRQYESTRSERKGDAQKLLTDRLGDVGKGILVNPKANRITFEQALRAVVDNMKVNGRQHEGTERRIEMHLLLTPATATEPETGYFTPGRRFVSLTTSEITAYTARRIEQGAKAATVNHELKILRRAFRLALRGKEISEAAHVPLLEVDNVRQGFLSALT